MTIQQPDISVYNELYVLSEKAAQTYLVCKCNPNNYKIIGKFHASALHNFIQNNKLK